MSERYTVETLPAMYDEKLAVIATLRKDLQDGVFDRTETPVQIMMIDHEIEHKEKMEFVKHNDMPIRNSANIETLYNFIQVIDADMRFAMHPNHNGKIRNDNMVDARLAKYYKVSIKKYARQIKIIFDGLIKYDNYRVELFDDYERIVRLVEHTDEEVADEHLLKLVTIAKQMIPPDLHLQNSFVIDSNSVDITKVSD